MAIKKIIGIGDSRPLIVIEKVNELVSAVNMIAEYLSTEALDKINLAEGEDENLALGEVKENNG